MNLIQSLEAFSPSLTVFEIVQTLVLKQKVELFKIVNENVKKVQDEDIKESKVLHAKLQILKNEILRRYQQLFNKALTCH